MLRLRATPGRILWLTLFVHLFDKNRDSGGDLHKSMQNMRIFFQKCPVEKLDFPGCIQTISHFLKIFYPRSFPVSAVMAGPVDNCPLPGFRPPKTGLSPWVIHRTGEILTDPGPVLHPRSQNFLHRICSSCGNIPEVSGPSRRKAQAIHSPRPDLQGIFPFPQAGIPKNSPQAMKALWSFLPPWGNADRPSRA